VCSSSNLDCESTLNSQKNTKTVLKEKSFGIKQQQATATTQKVMCVVKHKMNCIV